MISPYCVSTTPWAMLQHSMVGCGEDRPMYITNGINDLGARMHAPGTLWEI